MTFIKLIPAHASPLKDKIIAAGAANNLEHYVPATDSNGDQIESENLGLVRITNVSTILVIGDQHPSAYFGYTRAYEDSNSEYWIDTEAFEKVFT